MRSICLSVNFEVHVIFNCENFRKKKNVYKPISWRLRENSLELVHFNARSEFEIPCALLLSNAILLENFGNFGKPEFELLLSIRAIPVFWLDFLDQIRVVQQFVP